MEIIRDIKNFKPIKNSALTIGSYDGIHIGHRKILSSLVNYSRSKNIPSVLITFNPHPRYVVSNNNKLSLIMSMEEKIGIIKELGIDYIYIIHFTKEFSSTTAKIFLDETVVFYFNPESIFVGYNHHFGKNREGNKEFLNAFCSKRNISLKVIKPVCHKVNEISSTRIRQLIHNGKIKKANTELGAPYAFNAKVVVGEGRGKGLKFPTANVIPLEKKQLMPKIGVYFISGRIDGLRVFGMCNFGTRPTFKENDLIMEIHFFNGDSYDIYGKEIRVEFLERIRDEKKFPSPEKLIEQLKIDKKDCLTLQSKYE